MQPNWIVPNGWMDGGLAETENHLIGVIEKNNSEAHSTDLIVNFPINSSIDSIRFELWMG